MLFSSLFISYFCGRLKKEDLDNISSLDSRSLITAFHYKEEHRLGVEPSRVPDEMIHELAIQPH